MTQAEEAAEHGARPGTHRGWLAAVGIVCLVFLTSFAALFRGTRTPPYDADAFFAPYYILLADHMRAGQFMVWDPWTQAGQPMCVYPEAGAFCPVTMFFAWLTGPTLRGYVIYWSALWLGGSLGMLVLARRLGAPWWGATVVALGYCFNGFITGHAQHMSWLFSFHLLPWIVWRLDKAVVERRWLPAVEAGALWGVSALAGYPALVMCHAGVAAAWAIGRALFPDPTSSSAAPSPGVASPGRAPLGPRLAWAIFCLTLLAAVGVGVMAPTYTVFLAEGVGYTDRVGQLPRASVLQDNALQARNLLSYCTPHLTTWAVLNPVWTYTDGSSLSIYVGIGTTFFAMLALVLGPRSAWRWWLAATALLALGVALGRVLPLRGWVYDLLPPTRYFRHASIFANSAVFLAFVLAALGTKDLAAAWRKGEARATWAVGLTAVAVGLAGLAGFWYLSHVLPVLGPWIKQARLLACGGWTGLIAAGLLAALACRRPQWSGPCIGLFLALALGDAYATRQLTRISLYYESPAVAEEWAQLVRDHRPELDLTVLSGLDRQAYIPYLPKPPLGTDKHLLPKKAVIRCSTSLLHNDYLRWVQSPALMNLVVGPRRIWFAPAAVEMPRDDALFEAFAARVEREGKPVMVVHPRETMLHASPASDLPRLAAATSSQPAAEPIDVRLVEYQPTRMALDVDCPRAGWLCVTDRWARGWSVTVNGEERAAYGGMFLFRAVPVPAGRSRVAWTYRPWGFPGLILAGYGLLGLAVAASVVGHARRMRIAVPAAPRGD